MIAANLQAGKFTDGIARCSGSKDCADLDGGLEAACEELSAALTEVFRHPPFPSDHLLQAEVHGHDQIVEIRIGDLIDAFIFITAVASLQQTSLAGEILCGVEFPGFDAEDIVAQHADMAFRVRIAGCKGDIVLPIHMQHG